MEAKKLPWWRRALEFALGGIRAGIGLFSRPAQTDSVEPLEENGSIAKPEESLEAVASETSGSNPEPVTEVALHRDAVTGDVETVVAPSAAAPESTTVAEIAEQPETVAEPDRENEIEAESAEAESAREDLNAAEALAADAETTVEPEITFLPDFEAQQHAQQEQVDRLSAEEPAAPDAQGATETASGEEPLAEEEREEAEPNAEEAPEQVQQPASKQGDDAAIETMEAESDPESAEPLLDEPAAEEPAANEPAPETAQEAEPAAAAEPLPEPEAAPMEQSAVAESEPEPAPVAKAPAPAAKPFIKLQSRDDEANLSPFSVVVEQVYDGPLDLLLDLIRKQDIDIYDIPIAKITAQFLAYVNQLKASDVDVAGEFIYIASLLIHIKSKMLLPRSPSGPEEAAEDPRRELVERLLEHERFKNAAQMLQQKQMLEAATWTNPGVREFQGDVAAEPEIAADTVDLVRIFREILERVRSRPVFNVDEDAVTVGQMIQFLARRLTMEDKPIALRRLLNNAQSERGLIAIFLALLELVRLQAVLLRQDRAFSEIFVKKHVGFDAVLNEDLANTHDDWK